MEKKLKILMITGVYTPDHNGAVRQCRQLVSELRHLVDFEILCGTNQIVEVGEKIIDQTIVTKVFISGGIDFKNLMCYIFFYQKLLNKMKIFDIVHIHGFSIRNAGVILFCRLLRKKIILKMTSFGDDDPISIMKKSFLLFSIYKLCHLFIGISPPFLMSVEKSGIPVRKYRFVPNGVDLGKFMPAENGKKSHLRGKYGFAENDKILLFVGHFSTEKNPYLVYLIWLSLLKLEPDAKLIFIGAKANHFEVNESIYENIKKDLINRKISDAVIFIDKTNSIVDYMQISNLLIMASEREGLPNVLLEAMSCGLPCIVKKLPGITDWLIKDAESGLLFDKNDPVDLSKKINLILNNESIREKISDNAKKFVNNHFSSIKTSENILKIYKEIAK